MTALIAWQLAGDVAWWTAALTMALMAVLWVVSGDD